MERYLPVKGKKKNLVDVIPCIKLGKPLTPEEIKKLREEVWKDIADKKLKCTK